MDTSLARFQLWHLEKFLPLSFLLLFFLSKLLSRKLETCFFPRSSRFKNQRGSESKDWKGVTKFQVREINFFSPLPSYGTFSSPLFLLLLFPSTYLQSLPIFPTLDRVSYPRSLDRVKSWFERSVTRSSKLESVLLSKFRSWRGKSSLGSRFSPLLPSLRRVGSFDRKAARVLEE